MLRRFTLKHPIPAISNAAAPEKQIPLNRLEPCSWTTKYGAESEATRDPAGLKLRDREPLPTNIAAHVYPVTLGSAPG